MKAAVFGANGYIGYHLIYYLNNIGWDVSGFDIQTSTNSNNKYYSIDITNFDEVNKLDLSEYNYIFFFIGLTGTNVSFNNYSKFINVNEIGLLNLLSNLSNTQNPPKVIFPSSRLVYKGKVNTPLTEDAEKEFKTIYASSKYNGEQYLQMYNRLFGIDFSVFRICIPYGNIFNTKFSYGTIGFFLEKAIKNEPITLYGDGNLKRTFTHVLDICKQMVNASILKESNGECYNINGETFSLKEVALLVAEKYNIEVNYTEWPAEALKLESGDTIFDTQKINSLIDSSLNHKLDQWIKE